MILIKETDNRFYLKKSGLKDAGTGVFAKGSIKAGEYLEIIGVAVEIGSPAAKCTTWAQHYKFAAKDKNFDRHIIPLGYAAIINHTSDQTLQNVEIRCLKSISKRNTAAGNMVYYFIRDVEKDEEILGNYGEVVQSKIDWVEENVGFDHEEWKTFLSHDLYNLGVLPKQMNIYKES